VFPDWVKKISVCRTKNVLIDRSLGLGYLQTAIELVTYFGTDRITFEITDQNTFNSDNYFRTSTNYSYSDGDIVRFITNNNGTLNTDIIDRVIKSEDGVTFAVDWDLQLATPNVLDGDIIEIYTPAKQLTTDTYYEIGQRLALTETIGDNRVVSNTVTLETFSQTEDKPTAFICDECKNRIKTESALKAHYTKKHKGVAIPHAFAAVTNTVSDNEKMTYFAGGFFGGSKDEFLKMSDTINSNIDIDLKENRIAIWHDESHMNRYFVTNPPTVILNHSYCYPEEWENPHKHKILA
jgi:uncharacterized protein YlaI